MASETQTKRITFNADAGMLARAQEVLGAETATETLNRSLAEVVRHARLARLARHRFPGLTPQVVAEIRRPRTF